VATNTYEGDNALLTQQIAKYLVKSLSPNSSPHPDLYWLSSSKFNDQEIFVFPNVKTFDARTRKGEDSFSKAFRQRAFRLIHELAEEMRRGVPLSKLNMLAYRVSIAFCQYYTLESFSMEIDFHIGKASPSLLQKLGLLRDIYAMFTMDQSSGDWLEDSFMSGAQLRLLRQHLQESFSLIEGDMIGLVDAFDFPDFLLDSALGSYDGDAYSRLMQMAYNDPVNTEVNANKDDYLKYIRPIIKGGLSQSKL
jgi:acyl-CoA oxidase